MHPYFCKSVFQCNCYCNWRTETLRKKMFRESKWTGSKLSWAMGVRKERMGNWANVVTNSPLCFPCNFHSGESSPHSGNIDRSDIRSFHLPSWGFSGSSGSNWDNNLQRFSSRHLSIAFQLRYPFRRNHGNMMRYLSYRGTKMMLYVSCSPYWRARLDNHVRNKELLVVVLIDTS